MANSIARVFNRLMGNPVVPVPIAVVRMSREQAKLMSLVLANAVRGIE
jgi:hypothetical protein